MTVAEAKLPALERPPEPAGTPAPSPTPAPTPAPSPAPAASFVYDPRTMSMLVDGTVVEYKNGKMGTEPVHKFACREDGLKTMSAGSNKAKPAASPAPTSAPSKSDPPTSGKGGSSYVTAPDHPIPEDVDPLLVKILSWPRRHKSLSELAFCTFLRNHIKGLGVDVAIMAEGCLMATVKRPSKPIDGNADQRQAQPPSTTLFSCHVDTIEGSDTDDIPTIGVDDAPEVRRKKLTYDPNFGLIALDKDSIGGSLGADDGAGVWLMLNMIERKVPGTYIFHRGEEVGGHGSSAMRDKYPEVLKMYECAIAFDRHDTFEVIHTQGGSECASTKFTAAVCDRLNKQGLCYQPSSRGVFTDTKNYRSIIPECINIAVGYQSQHGRNENLDYAHLNALVEACCRVDWDSLPIDRDPKKADTYYGGGYGGSYGGGGYGRQGRSYPAWTSRQHQEDLLGEGESYDDLFTKAQQQPAGAKKKKKRGQQQQGPSAANVPYLTVSDELATCSLEDIEDWATDHPIDAAKCIGQLLVEIATLKASNESAMNLLGWKD